MYVRFKVGDTVINDKGVIKKCELTLAFLKSYSARIKYFYGIGGVTKRTDIRQLLKENAQTK